MVNRDSLIENFSDLGFDPEDDVVDKCIELCRRYKIDESIIVDEWVSYSVRGSDDMQLSVENLTLMEKTRLQNKSNTTPSIREINVSPSTPVNRHTDSNWNADESNYGFQRTDLPNYEEYLGKTDVNQSETRINFRTPVNIRSHLNGDVSKRFTTHSPRTLFSPASFSPVATISSKKYKERTNAGLVLCELVHEAQSNSWKTSNYAPQRVSLSPEFVHIPDNVRFMFENIGNLILASKKIADSIGLDIIERNEIKFPVDLHHISMETTIYAGRVKCDSNGKLNTSSIIIENCLSEKRGESAQLQVSDLSNYSLFPGQIVVIEGKNLTGTKIIAEKLHVDVKLPLCPITPKEFLEPREPMHIVVAAGPFTTNDTLSHEPWEDLLSYILEHKPHVVVVIGPIIDCFHLRVKDNSMTEPFMVFFERQLEYLLDQLQNSKTHTKVVFVSSWREAGQLNVYPTPCIHTRLEKANLLLAPDPCLLDINGVQVGVTSTDILMHLGKEELFCSTDSADRLSRLVSHLFSQRNFYPLMPPAEEISIDYGLFSDYGMLPFIPHILIVPSELKHFVKNVNGSIVINPERLAKGQAGGSFARIEIASVTDGGAWSPESHVSVQVVKI